MEGQLLDIGTGGSVFPLISSSRTASEIITTGYLESERIELQKWLKGDADAISLTPCFEYAARLEGNGYAVIIPDIEHIFHMFQHNVLAISPFLFISAQQHPTLR